MSDNLTAHNAPRPYDLENPAELARLFRETSGYLLRGGTDIDGRRYAREAFLDLVRQMSGPPMRKAEGGPVEAGERTKMRPEGFERSVPLLGGGCCGGSCRAD